jgi:hypothetical protein
LRSRTAALRIGNVAKPWQKSPMAAVAHRFGNSMSDGEGLVKAPPCQMHYSQARRRRNDFKDGLDLHMQYIEIC